jgi:CRP-like cAMP-binding protein
MGFSFAGTFYTHIVEKSETAVVPTQLLRLDQEPFFELMESQPQLAHGIITMLSARLRSRS